MPPIALLEKLLHEDPDDAFLIYGIAHEHAKAGRHELAIDFFDRCVAIDPAHSYGFYHMARSLIELGRVDEAMAAVEKGIVAAESMDDRLAKGELRALGNTIPTSHSQTK